MNYLRLLRIRDQFVQFGFAIASGLWMSIYDINILIWAASTTLLSFAMFAVNELVDRNDTDRYSWNDTAHIKDKQINEKLAYFEVVLLTVIGLILANAVNLVSWALTMSAIGFSYSLKPIRLKSTMIFDVLTQLAVWVWIPFLAPMTIYGGIQMNAVLFIISFSFLVWSFTLPYQLADYFADKKAGIKGTHIFMGLKGSIYFGIFCMLIGLATYFLFDIGGTFVYSYLLIAAFPIPIYYYVRALTIKDEEKIASSFEDYVIRFKPMSIVIALLLLSIWLYQRSIFLS